jgi:hypothetical protein
MGSFVEGSKNPTTQTSTPKYVEEVAIRVMQASKATKLFQTMAIMSLNMGNLNREQSEKQIGHIGEGKGSTIGGIGQGGLPKGV